MFVVLNNDFENDAGFDVAIGSTATTPSSLVWKHSSQSALNWAFERWIGNDRVMLHGVPEGFAEKCARERCDYVVARSADGWAVSALPAK
jgi:hypothetical protein